MRHLVLYIPVDKPLTCGCTVIDQDGDVFTYRETDGTPTAMLRVAEPHIVREEYNQRTVVGPVNDKAMAWLRNKQEIPSRCIMEAIGEPHKIMCPTCGAIH